MKVELLTVEGLGDVLDSLKTAVELLTQKLRGKRVVEEEVMIYNEEV